MGLIRLLTSKNGLAFVVCNLVGFGVASLLPPGLAAFLVSMLLSYHLFLAWLLVSADRPAGFSLPIVPSALMHLGCVSAVVGLPFARHVIPFFFVFRFGVIFIAKFESGWLFDAARNQSNAAAEAPQFAVAAPVSTMMPAATALAQNVWAPVLVADEAKAKPQAARQELPPASIANPVADDRQSAPYVLGMYSATVDRDSYLASDDNEWIKYLGQALRVYRKPGITLHEEYRQWLAARARVRRPVSAVAGSTAERQAAS